MSLKQRHDRVRVAFHEMESYLFGEDRIRAAHGFYNETMRKYERMGEALTDNFAGHDEIMRPYLDAGIYLTESAGKVQNYFDSLGVRLNQVIWLREVFAREKGRRLSPRLSRGEKIKAANLVDRQAGLWKSFQKASRSLNMRLKGGDNKLVELVEIMPEEVGPGFLQLHIDFEMAKVEAIGYLVELKSALRENIIDNPL